MTDADVTRWLADHARPIAEVDDDLDSDGVDAWVRATAGARVVAIGPAVGGTRELALLATRLIEASVRAGGVGALALQAGESATTVLDDHVRHGTGSPGEALERLGSWSWNTREVLDLVRTLAEDAAVPVVGIDPRRPANAVRVVGAFLRTAAPDALPPVADALADLALGHGDASTRAAVDRVRERLDRDVPALIAATSPAQYEEAVRHAEFLARAAELAATPPARADSVADRLMADAVIDAAGADGRVVLWAHADHVVVRGESLGRHLRDRYGDGYRALVLSAGSGSTRALRRRRLFGASRTPKVHRFPAAPAASLEGTVLAACPRDSLVDLSQDAPPAAWTGAATTRRSVGDEVSPAAPARAFVPCVPGSEIDGVAVVSAVRPGWVR
ncbi:erythromycin esterase [Actinomycetospora succinea]|uniref:Erythromycin esterase n=1 Tax=Actinomycetospora succinea TaxID=663603 RepID=A0A4R6V909_9PSEU|nr:erythromycin esterase family protein [Actinomycetospora succinea]TDQ58317.1 erythromycin esterase [Actinomycetospora succinea]